jgi:hypothetical protein
MTGKRKTNATLYNVEVLTGVRKAPYKNPNNGQYESDPIPDFSK